MAKCIKCGIEAKPEARFCMECGASLAERLCANGHVMELEWETCKYCPSTLSAASTKIIKPTRVVTPLKPVLSEQVTTKSKPLGATRLYVEPKEDRSVPIVGWVVVIEGKNKWRDFRVAGDQVLLGRDHDCEIVIDDIRASARHASIRVKEDKIFITDLDSSNGTFVNGIQINRLELDDGAEIRLGDTVLKFKRF